MKLFNCIFRYSRETLLVTEPLEKPTEEETKTKDQDSEEQYWIGVTLNNIVALEKGGFVPSFVDDERIPISYTLETSKQIGSHTFLPLQTPTLAPLPLLVSSNLGPKSLGIVGQLVDIAQIGPKHNLGKHANLSAVEIYKFLYITEDKGQPMYASAVLILPNNGFRKDSKVSSPKPQGLKTILWCHGTTGIQWHCAPSNQDMESFLGTIPGVLNFLTAGYVIVAPDYPGLGLNPKSEVKIVSEAHSMIKQRAAISGTSIGIPPVHPYLVGVPLAKSICHAAVAICHSSPQNPWDLPSDIVLFGHSEGGFAVIWASKLWNESTREIKESQEELKSEPKSISKSKLKLCGAAISSPATALGKMIDQQFDSAAGKVIGSYGLYAWQNYYQDRGLEITDIAKKDFVSVIKRISESCIQTFLQMAEVGFSAWMISRSWYRYRPTQLSKWAEVVAENTPKPEGISCPVFLVMGGKDDIVPPKITQEWGMKLRFQNTRITFAGYDNESHFSVPRKCLPELMTWIKGL